MRRGRALLLMAAVALLLHTCVRTFHPDTISATNVLPPDELRRMADTAKQRNGLPVESHSFGELQGRNGGTADERDGRSKSSQIARGTDVKLPNKGGNEQQSAEGDAQAEWPASAHVEESTQDTETSGSDRQAVGAPSAAAKGTAAAELTILGVAQVVPKLPPLSNHCGLPSVTSHFKKLNMLLCVCAKCGSTSAFHEIYSKLFGEEYGLAGPPWIQRNSRRWKGERIDYSSWGEARKGLPQGSTMVALVRDPYDRLLSAWRGKFRCGSDVYDKKERSMMVGKLLRQAGVPRRSRTDCLSLSDFAMAMQQVYLRGDACKLEKHVRPQSLSCFAEIAPANYTLVATAQQISTLHPAVFGNMKHMHKSSATTSYIHPTTEAILRQLASVEEWTHHIRS